MRNQNFSISHKLFTHIQLYFTVVASVYILDLTLVLIRKEVQFIYIIVRVSVIYCIDVDLDVSQSVVISDFVVLQAINSVGNAAPQEGADDDVDTDRVTCGRRPVVTFCLLGIFIWLAMFGLLGSSSI